MAITPEKDKTIIKAILDTDPYLIEYLEFTPQEIYKVPATDELLGTNDDKNKLKQQIFIYNTDPEKTINTLMHGIVYEVDVSVPYRMSGTADNAMEQIMALLDKRVISHLHKLELLDPPRVLPSPTSLYQVGARFVCYVCRLNTIKQYIKNESEEN